MEPTHAQIAALPEKWRKGALCAGSQAFTQGIDFMERETEPLLTPEARRIYKDKVARNLTPSEIDSHRDAGRTPAVDVPLNFDPLKHNFRTLNFTRRHLDDVIREASKVSAGGPSKWSFSMFQKLSKRCGSEGRTIMRNILHAFTRMMASNSLPCAASAGLVRMSRGVSIPKKGNDIRPLAIGEAIRRLACKVIARTVGNAAIEEAAGVSQFAAGTHSGTDLAGLIPELGLEMCTRVGNGPRTLVSVDSETAFQTIFRNHVLNQLHKLLPDLLGVACALYHGPSRIILTDEPEDDGDVAVVDSEQGVHQGCVFGTSFFSIGARSAFEEIDNALKKDHPLSSVSGFADDLTMLVRALFAAGALQIAQHALHKINLTVNPSKTEVVTPLQLLTDSPTTPPTEFESGDLLPQQVAVTYGDHIRLRDSTSVTADAHQLPLSKKGEIILSALNGSQLQSVSEDTVRKAWNSKGGMTIAGTPLGSDE